jgi:hypothetical protein
MGQWVFDAFPENPAHPNPHGVESSKRSLEFVLRRGVRHCVGVLRYDLPDLKNPGKFLERFWTPVNHPIKDGCRTVAVLHHTENVTRVLTPTAGNPSANRLHELHTAAAALHRSFPSVSPDEVVGVLAHSRLLIADTLGSPSAAKAQQLARLRLELQSGVPAIV